MVNGGAEAHQLLADFVGGDLGFGGLDQAPACDLLMMSCVRNAAFLSAHRPTLSALRGVAFQNLVWAVPIFEARFEGHEYRERLRVGRMGWPSGHGLPGGT